jgi:HEPN domain-containing protein
LQPIKTEAHSQLKSLNRDDFQQIALTRLKEAKALLSAGFSDGAYYLGGYVVEFALKAFISKQTRQYDFPEKELVKRIFTHNVGDLLKLAGLEGELQKETGANRALEVNWTLVKDWSEESRYLKHTEKEARDLLSAIEDAKSGVLVWLQRLW